MRPTLCRISVGLLLALVIGGCSGQGSEDDTVQSDTSATTQTTTRASAAGLPECAGAGEPVGRPPGLPDNLPLPDGTVITSREERSGSRLVVEGFVPAGFEKTLGFFQQELPEAGFELGEGEVEPERQDAESNFEGQGYLGRWKVSGIPGCENATSLSLLTQHK